MNDLFRAIKLELQRFRYFDVDRIVIKSHKDVIIARNLPVSKVDAFTIATALRVEMSKENLTIPVENDSLALRASIREIIVESVAKSVANSIRPIA